MKLVTHTLTQTKAKFWQKHDYNLMVPNYKFKIRANKLNGYYAIISNLAYTKWYFVEANGKNVNISTFTLGEGGKALLWEAFHTMAYKDIKDTKTGLLPSAKDIIQRYLP